MIEAERLSLVDYLTRNYDSLKRRLTQTVGNAELAEDAMQDTWVRMKALGETKPIANQAAYLLRTAVNIAIDSQRRGKRWLSIDEVEALKSLADPTPGPEQVAIARTEFDGMLAMIEGLSPRRREVFVLVHWENRPQPEIARLLRVSLRTIEYDLKFIHDQLAAQVAE